VHTTGQNEKPLTAVTLSGRHRLIAFICHPRFAILLVAPLVGEVLSTATPPLDLLLPWNLALMMALYGGGALICREVARRYRLGLLGLCLLGAAYAVYEEALVDRYWFDPGYWKNAGVGSYSAIWHTNLLLAAHLTAFHVAVSICSSIVLVEQLFPAHREKPWAHRPALAFAALALASVAPITYDEFTHVPAGQLLVAASLCFLLVVSALLTKRRSSQPAPGPGSSKPVLLSGVAFAATAIHFVLVYLVATTGIPWPIGLLVALAPIAAGVFLTRRSIRGSAFPGPDGLRVVTGILGFFLLLDAFVGLGGRYDFTIGALVMAFALWRLNRRRS
jgi:hypothetical protein